MNVSKIDQFCKLHGLSRTDLEATIKHYIGEMYFLRAYEYFKKLQLFGDFPIIDQPLAIGKWERSIYGPSISQLLKVAHYFRVPVTALIVDEEAKA